MHNVLSLQQTQSHSTTRFGFNEMQNHTFLLLITLILISYFNMLPKLFLRELGEDGQHMPPSFLSHSLF